MKNKCVFHLIGKVEVCGKNCYGMYCRDHTRVMKSHASPPTACLKCGVGTFSCVEVCRYCSGGFSSKGLLDRINRYVVKTGKPFEEVRDFLLSCK